MRSGEFSQWLEPLMVLQRDMNSVTNTCMDVYNYLLIPVLGDPEASAGTRIAHGIKIYMQAKH